ncbi:MAG: efflux RND transporter periplasmic adaptor subunit [Bacteroidota bacterium]
MLIKMEKPGVMISVIAMLLCTGCGGAEAVEEKQLRVVVHEEVGFLGGSETRTFSGTAETDKIVNLSFRSGGIVTRFDMQLGQRVEKGQLLARLDNVQSRLAYEQSLSSLNSAASQMNTAKLNLDRIRSLYEKGSASLSDFENAKNSFKTAEASHQSALRSVDIQKEQVRYGYIYAPETGTIASVNAEVDENVGAGQTVAVLNAGADMEISLGLPESVINQVRSGAKVDLAFSSLAGQSFEGRVSEVSPSIDPNNATYPVRIEVLNPSAEIRSGMSANVTFDFADASANSGVLVVPAKAVGEDGSGRFVFLVEEQGSAGAVVKKQPVQIGSLTEEGFEVLAGLSAGQKIATAGLQTLLNGQAVRLQ